MGEESQTANEMCLDIVFDMGSMAHDDAGPSHTFAHGDTSRSPSTSSTTFSLPTTYTSPPLTTRTAPADVVDLNSELVCVHDSARPLVSSGDTEKCAEASFKLRWNRSLPTDFVRLDQDFLSPLAGKKQLYTYETLDFWEQIKTPGMSLKYYGLYLAQFRFTSPHLLAHGDGTKSAAITGYVYVHPSAKVYPSVKIGPNFSISANTRIGGGVRLISCIILDNVEITENVVVIHAIVGWKSSVGRWSRVQASSET
nr:mannose-1-phosphate guanyltransferase alpha-b [Quercus suber]